MKRKLALLTVFIIGLMSVMPAAQAKTGDIKGRAYHTDIVAYINNYAIPSYAVNGTSCVIAEDLRNFGFEVVWNKSEKTLNIYRNLNTIAFDMDVKKTGKPGSVYDYVYETDIVTYANGQQIQSYAINGRTVVPIESLTMFGEVHWVSHERALKMWIDGFNVRDGMQPVKQYSK